MEPQLRAVIDVGTNSVKLLVAEVGKNRVVPVLEQSEQTRLGRGFYESHRLQPAAVAATAQAVKESFRFFSLSARFFFAGVPDFLLGGRWGSAAMVGLLSLGGRSLAIREGALEEEPPQDLVARRSRC